MTSSAVRNKTQTAQAKQQVAELLSSNCMLMGTSNKGRTGAMYILRVPQKHMDCQVLNLICNVPRSEQRDPVNVKM